MNLSLATPAAPASFGAGPVAAERAGEIDAWVRTHLPCLTHRDTTGPCSSRKRDCAFDDNFVWREVVAQRAALEAPALLSAPIAPSAQAFGLRRRGKKPELNLDAPSRAAIEAAPRAWGQAAVWLSQFSGKSPLLELSVAYALRPTLSQTSLETAAQFSTGAFEPLAYLRSQMAQELVSRSGEFTFVSEHSWVLPPLLFEMTWLRELDLYVPTVGALDGAFGNLRSLEKLRVRNAMELTELPDSMGELINLKQLELVLMPDITHLGNVTSRLKNLEEIRLVDRHQAGSADDIRQQLFMPQRWYEVAHEHDRLADGKCPPYCHLIHLRRR